MKTKNIFKILIFFLLIYIFFQNRWIFSFKYDPEYHENFYYESQYSRPSSARGISDGTLYKYVGYRLSQGENPFNINWEIPPFAKVMYGYSSRIFGNPYVFSILCFVFSLVIFFKLLSLNVKNKIIPYVGVLMLIMVPDFSNQVSDTMLDLPLTFTYLIHIFLFFQYLDTKKIANLFSAGLLLGIAASIKPPIYIPFILLIELFVIYLNDKSIKNSIIYSVFGFSGYVLGYFVYFIRYQNPIPWVTLHKKIYSFYKLSKFSGKPLAVIKEMFNLGSWGFFYISGLISYFIAWKRYLKNKNNLKVLTLLLFIAVFLAVTFLIPYFPRYLLPLSFIFIFLIIFTFKENLKILLLICLLSFPFFYGTFRLHSPSGDVLAAARFIETRAYRELYRSINPKLLEEIPEDLFIDTMESFNDLLGVRKTEVIVSDMYKKDNKYYSNFEITYYSRFGLIQNKIPFVYENINSQWKLNWNWDYLYNNFRPGTKVEFAYIPKILNKDYEVYVIPRLMYDLGSSLGYLSYLTKIDVTLIKENLITLVPNDYEKYVGYLSNAVPIEERDKLLIDKGMVRVKEVYIDKNIELEQNYLRIN